MSELAGSRTAPVREAERAGVLLKYAEGISISEIQRQLGVSRPTIYKCIDKALAAGAQAGLKDAYHRPRAPQITEEAKAWVVSIACTQPKELGLAAELWSISAMAMRKREDEVFPNVAAVDVGASSHWVAVPPHSTDAPVREFGAMPDDLNAMAEWLLAYGVDVVALEATGVYWIPVYEVLEARGLKVWLVDTRQVKYVPGRKSDVQDCQWLQKLMSEVARPASVPRHCEGHLR